MKIFTKNTRRASSFCPTAKLLSKLNVKEGETEILETSSIAKSAVEKFRMDEFQTISEVSEYITQEYERIAVPSVQKEAMLAETIALVSRYLSYDGRKTLAVTSKSFSYNGYDVIAKPDFMYLEDTTLTLVSFSAGRQKMSTKFLKNGLTGCTKSCLETLGLLLYGMEEFALRNIECGDIVICYDSLKSGNEKIVLPLSDYTSNGNKASTKSNQRVTDTFSVIGGKCNQLNYDNFADAIKKYEVGQECSGDDCELCKFSPLCNEGDNNAGTLLPVDETQEKDLETIKFTKEQEAILSFTNGVALVNAGAGAGKTNTIAYRIADLILGGSNPSNILMLSFSNSAANEMSSRLLKVGRQLDIEEDMKKVHVTTFNGLGGDLIKTHFRGFGYTSVPVLMDTVKEYEVVIESVEEYGQISTLNYVMPHMDFGKVKGAYKYLLSEFRKIRTFDLTEDQYVKDEITKSVWGNYLVYVELLRNNNLIDFSDQINLIAHAIRNGKDSVLVGLNYSHIIVDEFQDTSDNQLSFLNYLLYCSKFVSLMMVGDASQAIYGFRGSSPESILNLNDKLLDEFREYYLSGNFRSGQKILDLADRCLAISGQPQKKNCTSMIANPGDCVLFHGADDAIENVFPEFIDEVKKRGINLSDVAIIAHNTSTLEKIKAYLDSCKIESAIRTPISVLSDRKVKAAICLAKFFDNTEDGVSLLKYIKVKNNLDMSEIMATTTPMNIILNELSEEFAESLNNIEVLLYELKGLDTDDAVYHHFYEDIKNRNFSTSAQLIKYISSLDKYDLDYKVTTDNSRGITLTTAHSSKGLEWKAVLVDIKDFKFNKVSDTLEYKELMRLLYVSITRAQELVGVFGDSKIIEHVS